VACLGQPGLLVLGPAQDFVFLVQYHIENVSDETFTIEEGKHFIKYACLPNCHFYNIFGVVTGLLHD
jgi:hypothetical protein